MNNWKKVWQQRSANPDILTGNDKQKIFLELKRSNGFDLMNGGLTYEALIEQYNQIKQELFCGWTGRSENSDHTNCKNVYEVGCGSGASLYLFENDGIQCGGLDYSEHLLESAKRVLRTKDLCCDEAVNLDTESKYTVVLSNSVFSYFEDEKYAYQVLEKMYEKTLCLIGIIDIHDIKKKEDFIRYRRQNIEDYEEKYKNLPKLFYSKNFFLDFAESHDMDIKFTRSTTKGYWNNDYVFHCYLYKCERNEVC